MDLYKELSEKSYNPLNECIKKINEQKEIILYGAGLSGVIISDWLRKKGILPKAFVDSNIDKVGQTINSIRVYPKSLITELNQNMFIIVCCGDYAIILNELMSFGICDDRVMYIDPKWIKEPYGLRNFINNNIDKLQEAFDLLEDDLSRKVFVNMLKYRISYNVEYIKQVCSNWKERYFDKELLGERKISNYVDGGGYTGDTIEMFVEKFGMNYKKIYVFEPNDENMRQLKKKMKKNNYHDIVTFQIGLSDKKEVLLFDTSSNIATRIDDNKGEKIECDTIDNILKGKQIDLIKMDIEGAESAALKGSSKLIKEQKPTLAICVYHKPEDYYEIPIIIKNMCPDYKIYFRQYELSDTETICYAIGE